MITKEQLEKIYIYGRNRIPKFLPHINTTLERFEINTPQRIRMFLAQIGHESGELRYVEEIASGEAYEGRLDLGNSEPGDGIRYKGRGLIQVTGRHNYEQCGASLGLPLVETPELLLLPEHAASSAGWFWSKNNLNSLADLNLFDKITRRINGGNNGEADRKRLYSLAFKVIK